MRRWKNSYVTNSYDRYRHMTAACLVQVLTRYGQAFALKVNGVQISNFEL